MTSLNCFCPAWTKKKDKGEKKFVKLSSKEKNIKKLHVNLERLKTSSDDTELKSTSFTVPVPFLISGTSRCKVKVMNHDSPVAADSVEADYEGGDEHDDILSMKRDYEFNFQACFDNSNKEGSPAIHVMNSFSSLHLVDDVRYSNTESMSEIKASGHVSDPGTGKAEFWASPKLKRSCSNLARRSMFANLDDQLPPSKCKSYEELQKLSEMYTEDLLVGDAISPISFRSHLSADKVILKKHSSSQILPSRSRKLWWKLFLWSHRNLHRTTPKLPPIEVEPSTINKHGIGGYSSDTVEPTSRKLRSPSSLTGESTEKGKCDIDNPSWNGFDGASGLWPQNQWVAFPTDSSPSARVSEWVKEASSQPLDQVGDDDHHSEDDEIHFPPSPESGTSSPAKGSPHLTQNHAMNLLEEISHANTVIRSLNTNSSVAHITGLGLKAIPSIMHFTSLRSVNLSANLIVHITPGSLPKSLHILNLSRNRISTIEGLRDLTRLRVLDLSYNRISRIGQGLSNCTLIKELYLAGNKISIVEGLHRLLKVTVLDLSFNKITTVKALGQLVANYNSLIAVNLLGNPIQGNVSNDLLRKALCGLLPKLALLNKQPINPQKARELRVGANAKAALGNSSRDSRRKAVKKGATQGSSSSHSVKRSSASASTSQKTKHRSKNRSHHLKDNA